MRVIVDAVVRRDQVAPRDPAWQFGPDDRIYCGLSPLADPARLIPNWSIRLSSTSAPSRRHRPTHTWLRPQLSLQKEGVDHEAISCVGAELHEYAAGGRLHSRVVRQRLRSDDVV